MIKLLQRVWSITSFDSEDISEFAAARMLNETRSGLAMMSFMAILILMVEAMLQLIFEPQQLYLYTSLILIGLSINMFFAARVVDDLQALHLLGITLLIVSGTAFVLLAHYFQTFSPMLFASITMLFVIIPMMPWGLREAILVTLALYSMMTISILGAEFHFPLQSLWTLQFLMLGTGMVSLSLVVRSVGIRKHDMETQFDLVKAHDEIAKLSHRDPLTGAWNRRYFDDEFYKQLDKWRRRGKQIHFMLMDIDDFKITNDTYGHEWGDTVLELVREAFNHLVVENGSLVRMGGDEFVLVFSDLDPKVIADKGVQRLDELVAQSKNAAGGPIRLSIGVATVPADIEIVYRQLYKQADLALYMAKANKGEKVAVPNIVISTLTDPQDVEFSTIRLWNSSHYSPIE